MSKEFRVCLDIGHFTAGNNDAVAYLRAHHDRITHIHVKDRKKQQADGKDGDNVPFGQGDTPIKETLQLMRDNKWRRQELKSKYAALYRFLGSKFSEGAFSSFLL